MKKITISIIFNLIVLCAFGQRISISGEVKDLEGSPLPSATVMLLSSSDSTLINFTVTSVAGGFQMKNINRGSYLLQITFVGFETYRSHIAASEGDLKLGELVMQPAVKQLDEVTIEGEKMPVVVKRDTIEFNAGSFKVKQNATVEDLLKKLPGIEVENDGNVKAQGEDVQRVMVDGREFFGRDPKLATRNLPADAVDKVQVFDKKSDQSVFTGIDDGQREKTINLELKEEKRNGAFGTLMAGLGSSDRYEAKASINKFSKASQLSFLGMGNNINDQGFSLDDYMNFTGGSQQMMGGGGAVRIEFSESNPNGVPLNMGGTQNGITSNLAGGINFNKDVSKDTKAGGSYFYNHVDQDVTTNIDRVNYLPSGNYFFNQDNRQRNLSDNQRLNFSIDHRIDSANSIKLNSYISSSRTDNSNASESSTYDASGVLQNESSRLTSSRGSGVSLNSDLLYRHRFSKKGRSASANFNFGFSDNENKGSIGSLNQFYSGITETRNISQQNNQANDAYNYGITSSFTEPLGGRKYLEVNYSYRVNSNRVNRDVLDVSGSQQQFDSLLSSKYKSEYTYNRPGLNFRLIRQKFNILMGASYQTTRLVGDLIYQRTTINKSFENILPVVRFNYDFTNFKHLRLDYETSMQEPIIQELQPVVNNSDPLNLVVGNPDLRPGYAHQIRGNFTVFDPATFINLFAFVTGSYTANAISTSQLVDQNLIRTTKPVNVANNYSVDASIHFGFPVKKIKSRIGLTTSAVAEHGITLLNNQENAIDRETLKGTVKYSYSLDEIINIDLSASLERQRATYDFSLADQLFFNKTYEAEANLKLLKNYQLNPRFRYLEYNSQTTGFQQSIPLVDISFSRFLLKNNVGELKIGVNNVLDKNISVTQSGSTNYLEQRTYNNLGRYYMISFTYALNKQLNPMSGNRGGHVIRR